MLIYAPNMRTINKKILLKPVMSEVTSSIIAPTDIEFYEVVCVGDKVEGIQVGDKVFYHQGVSVTIEGQKYVSLVEDDIQIIL